MIQGNLHRYEALKPIAILKVSLALVLRPSTVPAEMALLARNPMKDPAASSGVSNNRLLFPRKRRGMGPYKKIEQKRSMPAERSGYFFAGVDFGAHGAGAQIVEKSRGPIRRDVIPIRSEGFLEKKGSHWLEVVFEQIGRLEVLAGGAVRRALEQTPAASFQDGGVSRGVYPKNSAEDPNLL